MPLLSAFDIERILSASHDDPFSVLGPHEMPSNGRARWCVRAFLPGARKVGVTLPTRPDHVTALSCIDDAGLFEGVVGDLPRSAYRLQVTWQDGRDSVIDDPYRFAPLLGDLDAWLFGEGSHLRPYEVLGATRHVLDGIEGTGFAVWAPNASRVSVVGDFNMWDGRRHPMRLRRECGVWEIFLPGLAAGTRYKYEIRTRDGVLLPLKADPYALQSELRPATASVVARLPAVVPPSPARQSANALDAPISIYEVHLGSWRRVDEGGF